MSVRTLRVEKSTSKEPVDFEQWIERGMCLFHQHYLDHEGVENCALHFQLCFILVRKDGLNDSYDIFR